MRMLKERVEENRKDNVCANQIRNNHEIMKLAILLIRVIKRITIIAIFRCEKEEKKYERKERDRIIDNASTYQRGRYDA